MHLKNYEISDHLGNVRAVVSDLKESTLNGTTGAPEDFEPVVATISNYYSFGMLQAGRNFNSGDYEYGFNGKRMDSEVSGTGNSYDYGFRIYNPRIGKFLSVDPLFRQYAFYTPYQFAGNNPIKFIDLDGLEQALPKQNTGKTALERYTEKHGKVDIYNPSTTSIADPKSKKNISSTTGWTYDQQHNPLTDKPTQPQFTGTDETYFPNIDRQEDRVNDRVDIIISDNVTQG